MKSITKIWKRRNHFENDGICEKGFLKMDMSSKNWKIGELFFVMVLIVTFCFVLEAQTAGDGMLLKRSPEETCHGCHKTDQNAPLDPDSIKTHNSANMGSSKWSPNGWGIAGGKYGEFKCTTCHTAHDTKNIYLIREMFVPPDGTSWDTTGTSAVSVTFKKKKTSDTPDPGVADGVMGANYEANSTKVCEVCHSQTTHFRWDGAGSDQTHTNIGGASGIDCTLCHSHMSGFRPAAGSDCGACHKAGSDNNDYVYGNGTTAKVSDSQWSSTGHGKTTGTYAATGNPAADLPGAAGGQYECLYCHDGSSNHGEGSNPFRLANTSGADGQNGVCLVCHKAGSAGYDPDGAGAMALRSGTVKMDSAHFGTDHGSGNNGGKFCWDCHDPHGDGNAVMFHDSVAKQSDGTYGIPAITAASSFTTIGTWSSYVNNSDFNGICQVCHSTTARFTGNNNYDSAHYTSHTCSTCHSHNSAFALSAECGLCHPATASNPPTDGNHPRHAGNGFWIGQEYNQANRQYDCSICHKGIVGTPLHMNSLVNWTFDTTDPRLSANSTYSIPSGTVATSNGVTRAYGTCNNVYCHSKVQTDAGGALTGLPGEYTTPTWGTQTGCYGCHAGTVGNPTEYSAARTRHLSITTGSHFKHKGLGDPIECQNCHDWRRNNPGFQSGCRSTQCHGDTGEKNYHVNGSIDLFFATAIGPSAAYNGGSTPGNGYSTCSNVYCHSNGTSIRTGTIPANTTPVWGSTGPLACNACHGNSVYPSPNDGMPNYANGSPKENSHPKHVIDNGIPCQSCHSTTTTNGTSVTAAHIRKFYYYGFSGSFAGKTINFRYYQPTLSSAGYCSNISCHGYSAANLPSVGVTYWGARMKCSNCHLNANDTDNYVYGGASLHATVGSSQWTTTGHGKASGTYTATGNPAANLPGAAGSGDPCSYCHDNNITHNTAANPFLLANTGGADGQNGNCLVCHKTGSAGYDPDGASIMQSKNGTVKISTAHYGADHGSGNNGGKFCWDCHDPHGDTSIAMIQASVTKQSDGTYGIPLTTASTSFTTTGTWGSYVNNATFNGVCQVCHTTTALFAGSGNYDVAHNPGQSCFTCHLH